MPEQIWGHVDLRSPGTVTSYGWDIGLTPVKLTGVCGVGSSRVRKQYEGVERGRRLLSLRADSDDTYPPH